MYIPEMTLKNHFKKYLIQYFVDNMYIKYLLKKIKYTYAVIYFTQHLCVNYNII